MVPWYCLSLTLSSYCRSKAFKIAVQKLGEISRRCRRHDGRPQHMLDEQARGVESGCYLLRQLKHQPTHVVYVALFERRQEIVWGVSFLYAELALGPKARDLQNKAGSMIRYEYNNGVSLVYVLLGGFLFLLFSLGFVRSGSVYRVSQLKLMLHITTTIMIVYNRVPCATESRIILTVYIPC